MVKDIWLTFSGHGVIIINLTMKTMLILWRPYCRKFSCLNSVPSTVLY